MTTFPQQVIAQSLASALAATGVPARAEGQGVHWHVDAGPRHAKTVRVHCFNYDRGVSALIVGMNPANTRTGQRTETEPPREGAEYLTVLHEHQALVADGRTADLAAVQAAVKAWLAGRTLTELETIAPYVDAEGRVMRAIAAGIDPALRRDLGGDPSYELWVYGNGRSCRARHRGNGVECTFWFGPAQIAYGHDLVDVPSVIHAWLVDHPSIGELPTRVPGVTLGRHAEVLAENPPRWHWLHVLDRIANPDDVLAPLGPLINSLAGSPIATRFYCYSSLNRLCFSASSHYPWVNENLPMIEPGPDGAVYVDGVSRELDNAVAAIEALLRAAPVAPFFGNRADYDYRMLGETLARAGSTWRPQLRQRSQWLYLVGAGQDGRECTINGLHVQFTEGDTHVDTTWPTFDDVAEVVRRFCESGTPLAEVTNDPRALNVPNFLSEPPRDP